VALARHNGRVDVDEDRVAALLRQQGARFAFVFGSRASGAVGPDSDLDVGAWWGSDSVDGLDLAALLPDAVDLLVLDTAPLELAGRVAMWGRLLFDDDPPARVEWQATTRKIFLDERPRVERARREFFEAARRRG
jgi:predicted nucleotidyltransferase